MGSWLKNKCCSLSRLCKGNNDNDDDADVVDDDAQFDIFLSAFAKITSSQLGHLNANNLQTHLSYFTPFCFVIILPRTFSFCFLIVFFV